MMNTKEMLEYFRVIRYNDGNIEEALDTLATSMNFCQLALFRPPKWEQLCMALEMRDEVDRVSVDNWPMLVSSSLFLVLKEIPEDRWVELFRKDIDGEVTERGNSGLYSLVRNMLSREIQKDLFDGSTIFTYLTGDEEWPADPEDPEEPWEDAFYYEGPDVEEEALNKLLLDQIRDLVSDMEWEILTAEHGDGPALAKKYVISESYVRDIRQRTIKRLQNELCDEWAF